MQAPSRLVIIAPNWLGDAVMALPLVADIHGGWPGAHLFEDLVQSRIVERAREYADRAQTQAVHQGVQLPVAEMAGEEEDTLALCVCVAGAILALKLDACQHLRV